MRKRIDGIGVKLLIIAMLALFPLGLWLAVYVNGYWVLLSVVSAVFFWS